MAGKKEQLAKVGAATRWKPGECGNPNGRPPLLKNVIKAMPNDAKEKVGLMMWTAISFGDREQALEYLKSLKASGEYLDCGIVLEMCINGLQSSQGWQVLMNIYYILFGTPRQTTDTNISGQMDYHFKFGDEQ